MGYAAVAVAGGRVYTSGNRDDRDRIWCLDAETGKRFWSYSYGQSGRLGAPWPGTQATPALHAGRLYHYSRDGRLFCLDAAGGEVHWWKDLPDDYKAAEVMHDYASSPLVTDGLVVVAARLKDAVLIAFEADTGREAWRANQPTSEVGGVWSTPAVGTVAGRRMLVHLTGLAVIGLDPASGKLLWQYEFRAEEGFRRDPKSGVAATPVLLGNRLVFHHHIKDGPTHGGCIEVRDGQAKLAWTIRELADQWHGAIPWAGRLYGFGPYGGAGRLCCLDPATGQVLWTARSYGETRAGGVVTVADGKLIQWRRGAVTVAELTPDGPRLLAEAQVCQERALVDFTVPVLAAGRLYLRATTLPIAGRPGGSRLICLDLRRP